ncbi:MAG: trypsin-like peptidase domain-containing protein [Candidatus Obscuribacterales bacterium]|nr:trypsin-like peptidase domain-containing protein [Steroidobacteraceae bacterium]
MKLRLPHTKLVLLVAVLASANIYAAAPTSELQRNVRNATFEVVMPKPTQDPLTYDKPLPLELIPFTERNDKYWSVGTAFAIDNESFISAAHVLLNGLGSRSGMPGLRDASGTVYPIDRILKFSLHEDFIVFSVKSRPNVTPLAVNREPRIDDAVFAVGNALGDGIVIRDGLFTSETAEEQDGRWKWIRFSAAASPGNSGGPLLDAQGRVVGIVIGKSDNENLNFALPISRLLNAPSKRAAIDTRWLQQLPFMTASTTVKWQQEFDLPKSYNDFATHYLALLDTANANGRKQLLDANSATMFPKGTGAAKLLTAVADAQFPQLVAQRKDNSWHLQAAENIETTELTDEGFVRVGYTAGVGVFQIRLPGNITDAKFYRDSAAAMNLALKALQLTRPVGQDRVNVTSLGNARTDKLWQDTHGRRWQIRNWSIDYMNSDVVTLMLPVPNGYLGLVDTVGAGTDATAIEQLKLLANLLYVSYAGSLQQWRGFLSQKELRPSLFEKIKIEFDDKHGLRYESPRLSFSVPPGVMDITERNRLVLRTTFLQDNDKLTWDVGGIGMVEDSEYNNYVVATRQAKPSAEADKETTQQWQRLRERRPPHDSLARPNSDRKSYWIATAVAATRAGGTDIDANTTVLYELTYSTEADVLPRDMEGRQRLMLRGTRVLER